MKHVATVAVLTAALLQGCAIGKHEHECPLDETGTGNCSSMQATYAASLAPVRTNSISLFDSKDAGAQAPVAGKPVAAALGVYPAPDKAMPVFQQPKVFRPWLAPYVDADGVLHAGEYAYFNTPGQWNYGELRKPGAGGAVMGPAKPWDTGFVPRDAEKEARKLSEPPAPPPAGAQQGAPQSGTGSITQPYQRLN